MVNITQWIENLNKVINIIEKNQIYISELKSTIIKRKNSLQVLHSIFVMEEKESMNSKIDKYKLPNLNKRENILSKNEQNLRDLWDLFNGNLRTKKERERNRKVIRKNEQKTF